jgi:hypothetical protein
VYGGGFRREHLAIKLGDLVLDLDLLPVKFSGFLEERGEVRHASLCAPAAPKIIEADLRDRCALRNKRFVIGSARTHGATDGTEVDSVPLFGPKNL